ncbi:hypothetical protein [Mangrovibacterium sp.]|uniref:hypothetical protein n=1 Tax=Mangrovibacterium sp. TaxID=1961364 RepID=UPI0035656A9C
MIKTVILTSSIFYLLGLKMSQNIESAQNSQQDKNSISTTKEQVETPVEIEETDEQKTLHIAPPKETKLENSDSGLNSIIRKKSTHLLEKMD